MSADPDRALEQLLADTSALRARLREENAEVQPPSHLDEAILAASRRAVSARPAVVGGSGLRRWQVPLAAAAVVVLATSVALLTLQEGEHERVLESAPPPVQMPASKAKSFEQPGKDASDQQAKSPDPARRSDEPLVADIARRESRIAETARQSEVATPQARSVPMRELTAAPALPASEGGVVAEQDQAGLARPAPVLADRAGQPVEPAAKAAPAPLQAQTKSADSMQKEDKLENVSPERRPTAEKRARAAVTESPDEQLALIRKRWEAGDQAGAREALAAFLVLHPGYPLPSGYPVPRPDAPPAQERPAEDR